MRIGALHWFVSLIIAAVVHVVALVFFVQPQARISAPKEVATGVVIELGDETLNPREDAGIEHAPRASAPDLGTDRDTAAATPTEVSEQLSAEETDTRLDAERFEDQRPDESISSSQSAPLPEVIDLAAVTSQSDIDEVAVTQLAEVETGKPAQAAELTAPSVPAARPVDIVAAVEPGRDVAVQAPSMAVSKMADVAAEVSVEQTESVSASDSAAVMADPAAVADPIETPPAVAVPAAAGELAETPVPPSAPVARTPVSGPVLDLPAVSPAVEAELTVRAPVPVTDKVVKDLPHSAAAKAPVEGAAIEATIVANAVDLAAAPVSPGESRTSQPPTQTVTMRQGTRGVTAQYQGLLTAWLQKHMRYPWAARVNGYEGTAVLRFTIRRDGSVVASRLERSSGHLVLDREAIEILDRAEPFPSIPPEMLGSELELRVPVNFFWKDFLKQREMPAIYLK